MSRYTEKDLKGLNKSALLQLVLRQPNVPIPRKLTTQLPTNLTKDKLRKLLTGPFGFIKEEQFGILEQDDISMQVTTGGVVECETNGQMQAIQEDVEMSSGLELVDPNWEPDQEMAEASKLVDAPLVDEWAPDRSESALDILTSKLTNQLSSDDSLSGQAVMRSEIDSSGACKNSACSAPNTSTPIPTPSNASTITEQLNALIRVDRAPKSERMLPSSLLATVASFPPDVSTAVQEYFMNQSQEVEAWESIDLARKKKKPDFAVIRYIRQVLTLHDRLKCHSWPTDTGTLRSKDLAKILGFSPPWFTNARHLLDAYDKVGPESGRANDAIKARFQERVAKKKGSDLLSFLRAQREIIELETSFN